MLQKHFLKGVANGINLKVLFCILPSIRTKPEALISIIHQTINRLPEPLLIARLNYNSCFIYWVKIKSFRTFTNFMDQFDHRINDCDSAWNGA